MTCRSLPDARPALVALALLLLLPAGAGAQEDAEPAQGMLLVAGTQIQDPRFRESVILLLSAGPAGSVGLIINKPTATKLSSQFPGIGAAGSGRDPLYFGGPVGGHQLLMLLRTRQADRDLAQVIESVSVTTNRMVMMDAMMVRRTGDQFRVFAGYAGWAVGQLEREIGRGDWALLPADAALVFRRDVQKLWPELIRKSREIMVKDREDERALALK